MAGDAYFKLACSSKQEQVEKRIQELYNGKCIDNECKHPFIDWNSLKWHDMEAHCLKVSREFPEVLIIINKKMNDLDLWENPFVTFYFKDGKTLRQESKIVWDAVDLTLLE